MSGGAWRGLESASGQKSEAGPMKWDSFFLESHLNFVIAIRLISSRVYLACGWEMSLPFFNFMEKYKW